MNNLEVGNKYKILFEAEKALNVEILILLSRLLGSYQNQVDTDKPGNVKLINQIVEVINNSKGVRL